MKITCLPHNKAHCDPPEAHIYPIGSPVFRGIKQFVQKETQKQLKITISTQQCLIGFSPTAVSQILNVCKEFYELQMLSTYYRHTPGQRLLEERKQLRYTSEMG